MGRESVGRNRPRDVTRHSDSGIEGPSCRRVCERVKYNHQPHVRVDS